MADFKIKPSTGIGNKLILESQDGTDVLTTSDSGVTLASPTLVTPDIGTPSAGVVTNLTGTFGSGITLPVQSGHVLQVVQYHTAGQPTRSASTWGGLSTAFKKSITITLGNTILISTTMHLSIKGSAELKIRLYDNTLSAYIGTEGSDGLFGAHVHDDSQWNNISFTYLYTPASGTVHDIEAHFISNGSNNVTMNNRAYGDNGYGRVTSVMILSEIAA